MTRSIRGWPFQPEPDVGSVHARPRTPRCGKHMTPYEAVWGPLLDEVTCGRPEGHNGPHRSVQAVSAALRYDMSPARVAKNNEARRARRQLGR